MLHFVQSNKPLKTAMIEDNSRLFQSRVLCGQVYYFHAIVLMALGGLCPLTANIVSRSQVPQKIPSVRYFLFNLPPDFRYAISVVQ